MLQLGRDRPGLCRGQQVSGLLVDEILILTAANYAPVSGWARIDTGAGSRQMEADPGHSRLFCGFLAIA